MKHLCALLLLCALCASVFAEHRTMEQAQQIAADFTGTTPDALTPVNNVKQAKGRTSSDQPAYYIFNSHPGYVIVSSAADTGCFASELMPVVVTDTALLNNNNLTR